MDLGVPPRCVKVKKTQIGKSKPTTNTGWGAQKGNGWAGEPY